MAIKKVPFSYVHPRKKQAEDSPEKLPVSDQTESMQQKTISILPALATLSGETVSVRLLASFPKPGVSAEFDEMIGDNISHKVATLALLKRGLSLLEGKNNAHELLAVAENYRADNDYVETIRSIQQSTYDWAKKQFDPHDILSARALGAKLGNAILSHYLSRL